jgi:phosphatidylglycerol:prolipoprotein diacylglycerol transferase
MHPVLFKIPIPSFLQGFLPDELIIYTYGALIFIGAILASTFMVTQLKKRFSVKTDDSLNLVIGIIFGAIVGGKAFLYFENPSYFNSNPSALFSNSGFVFFGSLVFALSYVGWFIRKHKLKVWPFLDSIAITTLIVHFFGRLGCFFAGCCHGVPYDGIFSVVFTDSQCAADPLNTPLHPTQLYSAFMLLSILIILMIIKKIQRFDGQLFLLYLLLYSGGRSVIEEFRGDEERGFVFDGFLSHSQLIAVILISIALYFYYKKWKEIKSKQTKQ